MLSRWDLLRPEFPCDGDRDVCSLPSIQSPMPLIYYDQRIRLEGFDIECMMDAAGMNAPVPAQTPEVVITGAPVGETRG